MNLVKWLRKNNMKIMAVVIIIILFGFIGGEFFRQLGQRRSGLDSTIAYFGDSSEITTYDRSLAHRELEILEALGANTILRNVSLVAFGTQDLAAILLGELLFPNRQISPSLSKRVGQMITAYGYRISNKVSPAIPSGKW